MLSLRSKPSTASTTGTSESSRDVAAPGGASATKTAVYPESEGRHSLPTSQPQEQHSYVKSPARSIKTGAIALGAKLSMKWAAFKMKHHH